MINPFGRFEVVEEGCHEHWVCQMEQLQSQTAVEEFLNHTSFSLIFRSIRLEYPTIQGRSTVQMENVFCNSNGFVSSAKAQHGLVLTSASGARASESLEN